MAHFEVLDENNVVTAVNVISTQDCLNNIGSEIESIGAAYCASLWGEGNYKQTSWNHRIRKQFAGIGYTYDEAKDIFIAEKPFASWVLNADNDWESPLGPPSNEKQVWDEDAYQIDNSVGWITNP